jgi:hypothetical protein
VNAEEDEDRYMVKIFLIENNFKKTPYCDEPCSCSG